MIFINEYGEAALKNGGRGIHVWLQDDVERTMDGKYRTDEPAMCGAELAGLPVPGSVDPAITPASEVWADSILTYLQEEDRMCEECRVRAAVYLGLIEDVEVWARTVETDQCGECGVSAEYRIEGVKGEGKVVRRAMCPRAGCGREISVDELTIPEPDRRPFERA